jgi:hypothetical protein
MAAPACSSKGAQATYLFVLTPGDAELDTHTGVVVYAMVKMNTQTAIV